MIRTARADKVRRLAFAPWAALDMPAAALTARGVRLHREVDDLDEYDVAYLELTGGTVVGLQAYVHDPRQQASVLLPMALIHQSERWEAIAEAVCSLLDLPRSAVHFGDALPPDAGSPCPLRSDSAAVLLSKRR